MGSNRCRNCERPLTNPISIRIGYGPKCFEEIRNTLRYMKEIGQTRLSLIVMKE